jgi:hypothetical protein
MFQRSQGIDLHRLTLDNQNHIVETLTQVLKYLLVTEQGISNVFIGKPDYTLTEACSIGKHV